MWTCVLQKVFRILSLYSPCGGSTTSTVVNTMEVQLTSRACWDERLKATGSILKKTRMLWKSGTNLPLINMGMAGGKRPQAIFLLSRNLVNAPSKFRFPFPAYVLED